MYLLLYKLIPFFMDTKNTIHGTRMNLKQTLRCGNLRGFTLVELVVTIAIIAILSTIGFASIG